MARHSHWHNIQITKGKADKKRAKVFGRFTRGITISAKEGGGDPNFNVRLRVAIEAAKAVNVPKDNIDRAIARGTGTGEGGALAEVIYEAYAPGRVATMIVCTTDNRNRTSGDVKNIVTKYGGTMASPGTFAFLFDRKAVVTLAETPSRREEFDLIVIDAGADDLEEDGESLRVIGSPKHLAQLSEAVEHAGGQVSSAVLEFIPKDTVIVSHLEELEAFLSALDELDDVDEVFVNAE
ncbi:MAG: YebC/PmpR family DNA-binding transcriptional regulator [Patescibacteria group bacterium]|jgi:YebC/PmpR family DNA-binding regulatory protein